MRAGVAQQLEFLLGPARHSRRNSRPCAMSTRSGRKCSISEVSTSPPWMPWRSSSSVYMPAGRPKRCQLVFTASILWRTRSSRRDDAHDLLVAAMRIDEDELAHAGAGDRRAELGPGLDQRRWPEASACPAHADARWTCRPPGPAGCGCRDRRAGMRDHLVQHALHDRGVGRHRQMRPVLLDRRDRQDGDRRLGIDRGIFGGAVVAPPARVLRLAARRISRPAADRPRPRP